MRFAMIPVLVSFAALAGQNQVEDFPNPASFPALTVKGLLTVKGGAMNSGDGGVSGNFSAGGSASFAGGLCRVSATGDLSCQDAGFSGSEAISGAASWAGGLCASTSTGDLNCKDAGFAGPASFAGGLCTVTSTGDLNCQDAGFAGLATVNGFKVPQIAHFSDAGTGGLLDVAVSPAFSAVPDCSCSNVNSTTAACDVTARSTSHIQAKSGSGTDVINLICVN